MAERIRNYKRFTTDEEISSKIDNINKYIEQNFYKAIKKKILAKDTKIINFLAKRNSIKCKKSRTINKNNLNYN